MNDVSAAKPGLGTLAIHSSHELDLTTGAVMVPLYATAVAVGGVQGLFGSFLALRGLKRLLLRMQAHLVDVAEPRAKLARALAPR